MKLSQTLGKSLWAFLFNSGSCNGCEIELVACVTPRYDLERFGIKLVGSPRHADHLLISGPVTRKMAPRLRRVYEQMPEPKIVVCVGTCGTSGGAFYDSYTLVGPVDQVVPVDMYVPGCPPRPEALLEGLFTLQRKLTGKRFWALPEGYDTGWQEDTVAATSAATDAPAADAGEADL